MAVADDGLAARLETWLRPWRTLLIELGPRAFDELMAETATPTFTIRRRAYSVTGRTGLR